MGCLVQGFLQALLLAATSKPSLKEGEMAEPKKLHLIHLFCEVEVQSWRF